MNGDTKGRLRKMGVALGAIGLAMAGVSVRAQPYDPYPYDDTTVGEIVVSPRNLGRSELGAPIRGVLVQRVVSFRDLDLATPWGRDALRARVEDAARSACEEMDVIRPATDLNHIAVQDYGNCYSRAVRNAMLQAEDLTGYRMASY